MHSFLVIRYVIFGKCGFLEKSPLSTSYSASTLTPVTFPTAFFILFCGLVASFAALNLSFMTGKIGKTIEKSGVFNYLNYSMVNRTQPSNS